MPHADFSLPVEISAGATPAGEFEKRPAKEKPDGPARPILSAFRSTPEEGEVVGDVGSGSAERLVSRVLDLLPPVRFGTGVVVAARTGMGVAGELRSGDLIHRLNGEPIRDRTGLERALARTEPGEPGVLWVERAGVFRYVTAPLR